VVRVVDDEEDRGQRRLPAQVRVRVPCFHGTIGTIGTLREDIASRTGHVPAHGACRGRNDRGRSFGTVKARRAYEGM